MWFAAKYPFLLCYSTSVSFCLPLNKVQQDRPLNRSSNNPSYSIAELATLFDQGKRIDIMAFGSFIPSACHQEFDLRFTDRV
jgi:hypothetical protein